MDVLITAGGTAEKIDGVRYITNTSTGSMGKALAEAFGALEETGKIWYICGPKALRPATSKAYIIEVESTDGLEAAIRRQCQDSHIDVAVHAMAVSDYAVERVTTVGSVADGVVDALKRAGDEDAGLARLICNAVQPEGLPEDDDRRLRAYFADAVRNAYSLIGGHAGDCAYGGKLSSNIDGLMISLKRTPKVIASLRGLLPDALIVGFKLLDGSEKETLMKAARELMERNGCDYVLANDQAWISGDSHKGFLLGRDGECESFNSKGEIAAGIVRAALRHCGATAR